MISLGYIQTYGCTLFDIYLSEDTSTHAGDARRVADVGTFTYLQEFVPLEESELVVEPISFFRAIAGSSILRGTTRHHGNDAELL